MQWSQLARVCALGVALALPSVYGHGRLTLPRNREDVAGRRTDQQNAPAPYGPTFACKGVGPQAVQTTLVAGQDLPVQWVMEAPHPGDCFFYLSYDTDKPEGEMEFFKIAQFAECDLLHSQRQSIKIPEWIPPCERCVLRFEWYAIQQVVTTEYYANCVDVRIESSAVDGVLGTPRVKVPGHLPLHNPAGSGNFRLAYQPPKRLFFTGPALATPDRAGGNPITDTPTTDAPTSVVTAAPTSVATAAPTSVATAAPTTYTPPPTTSTPGPTTECNGAPRRRWDQCGGIDYTGSTCCHPDDKCEKQNDYYSQCLPINGRAEDLTSESSSSSMKVFAIAGISSFIVVGAVAALVVVLKRRQAKFAATPFGQSVYVQAEAI